MTRLLLTGAQGFLGRHAAGAWLAADAANTVFGLGRRPRIAGFTHTVTRGERTVEAPLPNALAEILAGGRFHYEAIDLLDRPALVRALQQARPDVILHAAGAVRLVQALGGRIVRRGRAGAGGSARLWGGGAVRAERARDGDGGSRR